MSAANSGRVVASRTLARLFSAKSLELLVRVTAEDLQGVRP